MPRRCPPAWLSGAFAPAGSWRGVTPWLVAPGLAGALAGVLVMMSDPGLRGATGQVLTPFLSGLDFLVTAAVVVDLAAVLVDTFTRMERNVQMTLVGLTVLMVGAAFVGGAIFYKTRRAMIQATVAGWRNRLGGWE